MNQQLDELIDALRDYAECYPNERTTVSAFYNLLESWPRSLDRVFLPGHLTASAWTVSDDDRYVMLLYHRKLEKWLQPGGHADGDGNLRRVALKELQEEAGVTGVETRGPIFDVDIHDIPKYGEMDAHQHYDLRFLVRVPGTVQPQKNHESHEVRWHRIDSVGELTSEESIRRMVEKTHRLAAGYR